jgi:hypothetical protein
MSTKYYGEADSFVFKLHPEFAVYRWSLKNQAFPFMHMFIFDLFFSFFNFRRMILLQLVEGRVVCVCVCVCVCVRVCVRVCQRSFYLLNNKPFSGL